MKTKIILIALLAILYVVFGELSFLLLSGEKIVNLGMFIPEGIALGFAIYYGRWVVGGIFLGQAILAYINDMGFISSLEIALINSLEALIAIYLFKKFKLSKRLKSPKDIIYLALMIVFVLQPFSAIISNIVLYIHSQISYDNLYFSTFKWWFGNVMGQIIFAPFILLLLVYKRLIDFEQLFLVSLVFGFYICLLECVIVVSNPLLLLSLILPLIVFIIYQRGIVYGATVNVIVALVSSFALYKGFILFGLSKEINDNVLNFNLFILVIVLIVFSVGILFEQRRRYEEKLEYLVLTTC